MQSRPYYDAAATNTVVLAQKGVTDLASLQLLNGNAAITYIQLFDSATTAAVSLGSTAPTKVIKCEASVEKDKEWANPVRFNNGLCYALTTGAANSTAPSSVSILQLDLI